MTSSTRHATVDPRQSDRPENNCSHRSTHNEQDCPNKEYQEASPRQVQRWLQAGECVLIDVREPDEHARERIIGSRLMPLSRFDPDQIAAHAKCGQRVVMQCRSGARAAEACRMAAPLPGLGALIFTMTGGLEAWKKENLPVEMNTKVSRVSVLRQVQLVIGLGVLGGSVLAWFVDPAFIVVPAFFGSGLILAGATGTCGLAALLALFPWNKSNASAPTDRCSAGVCAPMDSSHEGGTTPMEKSNAA